MSILIKGMDMPSSCADCPLNIHKCDLWKDLARINCYLIRHKDCPLVEVKTPHGRLKDVDVLHEKMYHEAFEVDSEMQRWDSGCWIRYKVFENCESDCPTVIESEE